MLGHYPRGVAQKIRIEYRGTNKAQGGRARAFVLPSYPTRPLCTLHPSPSQVCCRMKASRLRGPMGGGTGEKNPNLRFQSLTTVAAAAALEGIVFAMAQ
eukprot:scaffold320279_cov19-Tisochrysis_lutea.AAC.1